MNNDTQNQIQLLQTLIQSGINHQSSGMERLSFLWKKRIKELVNLVEQQCASLSSKEVKAMDIEMSLCGASEELTLPEETFQNQIHQVVDPEPKQSPAIQSFTGVEAHQKRLFNLIS
jgi:hypothetical protein